ncbi:tetratricopeptide repeat protein [Chitinophaga oryziterrae]|uniref:histidine kinase n=1 Tax=Chitinophaga oryziterrae TaxID=1031224 RepID=A0A6N8JJ20_9BACT|nr:tetratricopeptide repeat-containing sensor histidine kinase [Chitinophaga oryziterrae]MVT44481.1 tetratricopeptide repeat protein [Chitinophaga oryziterrae]
MQIVRFRVHPFFYMVILCGLPSMLLAQSGSTDSLLHAIDRHPQRDTDLVILLNKVGRLYFTKDPVLTEKYGREAIHISDSLGYTSGAMWGKRNMALAENSRGNLDKQMDFTTDALKLAEQLNDIHATSVLNADIGNIFIEQSKPELALPYQKKALYLKQSLRDQAEVARSLNSIGSCYLLLHKPDSALFFLYESEKIKLSLNDHKGLAFTYENIGHILYDKGQYREALRYYEISEKYYRESDNLPGLTKAYLNLGRVNTALRKYTDAARNLSDAAKLNEHLQNAKNTMIYYKYQASLDSARGNYIAAMSSYKEFSRLSEQYFNVEKTKFIASTKEKYESEKKQRENEMLKKEQLLHLSTIKIQQKFVIFSIMLFFVLSVITSILFRMYRRQQDLYLQLNNRNKRVQQQNLIILEQNVALESASQVKDKIFSVISHDLRSPLAILEGMLFLLRDDKMSSQQFRFFVDELWRDMKNTSSMMDNLLQWASSQMKGMRVNADDFDITAVLNREFELLLSLAKQKNISLTHQLSHAIMVYGDPDMIRLVLRNLISNAIKFTPALGNINIRYLMLSEKIELIVEDNGIGIAEADQPKVLSNIYYSTGGTQNEKGCGLGLPLSKDFIERNEGEIWFDSQVGKGTSFHFTLPLSEEENNTRRGYMFTITTDQLKNITQESVVNEKS